MTGPFDFTTPREAVAAMIAAGAVFAVRRRDDALGFSFSYSVKPGGDVERCRAILADVKGWPPAFFQGFRAAVQVTVAEDARGAA